MLPSAMSNVLKGSVVLRSLISTLPSSSRLAARAVHVQIDQRLPTREIAADDEMGRRS